MKAVVLALVMFIVGCSSPCERTARHAMAMGRACIEIGDPAIRGVCERAYEAVREGLSGGACAAEVAK